MRSEYAANLSLTPKEEKPTNWKTPAPVREQRKVATLPQWLIKYLWRL